MRKGFTLIELLVVIAIIALLSSVVLASLNSARDKGRIGAGRESESTVYHAEADQVVGSWDFDECSGGVTSDRSGYGGTGTLTGGATYSTDVQGSTGCSVSFDGATGYVNVPNNSNLEIGTSDVTVAAWIKTSSVSPSTMVEHGVSGYSLRITGPGVPRYVVNSMIAGLGNGSINDGKWHFVVGVSVRASGGFVCIDGNCGANSGNVTSADLTNGLALTMGQGATGYFNGKLDAVRVYAKALTASDVGKLYAAERSRYQDVAAK